MTNTLFFLLLLVFSFNKLAIAAKPDTVNRIEILDDLMFLKGVGLRDTLPSTTYTVDTLHPFNSDTDSEFSWMLCQWSSKNNLKGARPQILEDNTISYSDSSKKISFRSLPQTTEITLALNSSKEYLHPRKSGEYWPHLLLEQNLKKTYALAELKKVVFNIDAKLGYAKNFLKAEEYNPNLHTAQFVAYIVISNTNTLSKGYGSCFYFGINIYDYRYKDLPFYASRDAGKNDATGNFIFCPAAKDIYKGSAHNMDWIKINKNIYPLIQQAFESAQKKGFLKQSLFTDFHIVGFNIGWEMPGTIDAEITIKNLSLQGVNNGI